MTTTPRENEEFVRRFGDAINDGDWDAFGELLAEDVVIHGEGVRGIDDMVDRHKGLHAGFPDQTLTVEDTVVEGRQGRLSSHGHRDPRGRVLGHRTDGRGDSGSGHQHRPGRGR